MSRKSFLSFAVIVLTAIFLASGFFVTNWSVGHAENAYAILHVVEHYNTNVIIDLGPKGDSMGDLNPFADPIYDAANKKQVGYESGSCIRTIVGKQWECNWTVFLKGGQISVEGPVYDASADATFAVIGGTGIYRYVRGQLFSHYRTKAGILADYVFHILY